jgi:protein-S-isoprenylcysteine O-methyltransferase Ste14
MPLTAPQKVGHVIGFALGLDMLTTLYGEGTGEDATPLPVLAVIVVMMVCILALLVRSWTKDSRVHRRIAAVMLVLNALLAVPGLFVSDVATWLRIDAGLCVLATIAAIVLLFYPDRPAGRRPWRSGQLT